VIGGDCAAVHKGGAGRGRKWIGRKRVNLIVGWCGRFLFFVGWPYPTLAHLDCPQQLTKMGFLTHIYEAEYYFPENTQLEAIREAIVKALESTPSYAHVTGEGVAQLFQRPGQEHSVVHAYHNHQVQNEDQTVYGTHTTKLWKFIDDLAFTFLMVECEGKQVPTAHTLSISRIGGGDLFQNRKNIQCIMNTVKATIPFDRVVIFQK